MTDGELRFYLREIHSYWTTPRISAERVAELLAAKLIERSADAITMIRLTGEGVREKTAARPPGDDSRLNHARQPAAPRRGRKKHLPKPRPFG